jgi:hypothetical protein
MRKRLIIVFAAILAVSFLYNLKVLTATEKQSVLEELIIANQGYKSDKKGPVPFSHINHAEDYELTCTQCHHDYQGGKNIWKEGEHVKKCKACHSPLKSKGKVKKLKLAFHKNCKNCHKDLAKRGIAEDAPYRKCNGCHEKKSK